MICLREKARSWRVMSREWLAAFSIARTSFRRGSPSGELGLDQLRVPEDDAQHIVEIVRHTPRQTSHRFHLLRLDKLRFELCPLLLRMLHNIMQATVLCLALPERLFRPFAFGNLQHDPVPEDIAVDLQLRTGDALVPAHFAVDDIAQLFPQGM